MTEWTEGADQEFAQQAGQRRAALSATGADPDEVAEDLRRHIAEEASRTGLATVTAAEVRRAWASVAVPPAAADAPAATGCQAPSAGDRPPVARRVGAGFTALVAFFGVFLPLLTLGIELLSGICASLSFDPIPTPWHTLLVACVPAANFLALWVLRRGRRAWLPAALAANGLALGVALSYAALFLPMTPFALLGVLYVGVGFIPLSPLVSVIVGLCVRHRLRAAAIAAAPVAAPRRGLTAWPLVAALLALLALHTSAIVTLIGVKLAVGEDQPASQRRGLQLLRALRDDERLLRMCYFRREFDGDLITWLFAHAGPPVSQEELRTVYYRVTGTPFNAVPPPRMRGRSGPLLNDEEFDFDAGGERVAARLRGLTLHESRLDTDIRAAEGTAYTQWTLVFRNGSTQQREARAQIVLPPGGVVSRLTLWVNGEEREAAFGGRAQVREAYQKVVRVRRDPVLVTTSGPDRVLLQCFPVPPGGGTMRVRVGITAPLLPQGAGVGLALWPRFCEENFGWAPALAHSVWVDADGAFDGAAPEGFGPASANDGHAGLRGTLAPERLTRGCAVRVRWPDGLGAACWTPAERGPTNSVILQTLVEAPRPRSGRLVLVVDGSRRMAAQAAAVAGCVEGLPEGVETVLLVAGDEVATPLPAGPCTAGWRKEAARILREWPYAGGCDNLPALTEAWEQALAREGAVIVWLHATQPIELSRGERLQQLRERTPRSPLLVAYQVDTGPNRIAELVEKGGGGLRLWPAAGDPASDLRALAGHLAGAAGWEYRRACQPLSPGAPAPEGTRASLHVARLWAAAEVGRLAATRRTADTESAVKLAQAYQLVTPVTGAVVLETVAQFKEAGLQPIDPASAPGVVPEPATLLLALVGGGGLLAARRGLRRWRG